MSKKLETLPRKKINSVLKEVLKKVEPSKKDIKLKKD